MTNVAEQAVETVVENVTEQAVETATEASVKAITKMPSIGKDTIIIGVAALGTIGIGIGVDKAVKFAKKKLSGKVKLPFGKKDPVEGQEEVIFTDVVDDEPVEDAC